MASCRNVANAEYESASPRISSSPRTGTTPTSAAPQSAPLVVAITRKSPTRMLLSPVSRYAAAAPLEVAITEMMLAPIA